MLYLCYFLLYVTEPKLKRVSQSASHKKENHGDSHQTQLEPEIQNVWCGSVSLPILLITQRKKLIVHSIKKKNLIQKKEIKAMTQNQVESKDRCTEWPWKSHPLLRMHGILKVFELPRISVYSYSNKLFLLLIILLYASLSLKSIFKKQ